jgi:LmbE family N-acetylglucosaminyl deacetylase
MRVSLPVSLLAFLLAITVIPSAQLRVTPVAERPDLGALELDLRKLASTGTFMQTAAHPDDEDNSLLAMLGEGQGMRTVLVTATRGNGGQNEIGPELFEPLGVLRTEELLAVHRFDGAEQYFTRAIDFGYSFSIEESIDKWGHDEILGDFVRLIRTVRPDVITGFLCGGEGGGQHHQASARLTVEAFRAAADPTRYPEQIAEGLHPWQAFRVFCTEAINQPAQQRGSPDLLTPNRTGFDPALGRTYAELGLEARSMHKCQGASQELLLPGEPSSRTYTYRLRDSTIDPEKAAPRTFFEGIDVALVGLGRFAGDRKPADLISRLTAISRTIVDAQRAFASNGPSATLPPLGTGLREVRELRAALGTLGLDDTAKFEVDFRLAQKERQFQDALLAAAGIRLDALSDDGIVTPGQSVNVTAYAASSASDESAVQSVTLTGFDGAGSMTCRGALAPATPVTCRVSAKIPANTHDSTPYWKPRKDAARYDFESDVPFGVSFRPSPFRAVYDLTIGGQRVTADRPVEYRYDGVLAGEKRMDLKVVPPFNVRVTPDIVVVPTGSAAGREIRVTVSNNEKGAASGNVALQVPADWKVEPASAAVSFAREDEEVTVRFSLSPRNGVAPGESIVTAIMTAADGATSSRGYEVIEYPHIHRQHYVESAATRVKVIDVTIAHDLRVGYVMGVGDKVPQAISQLGAEVELIDTDTLAFGDLSKYHVIVTGVRAYERRPDLRANNRRLIQYVESGGAVLVQYNKFEFNEAQYGPYPAKVSSNRVTDENAPILVLVPDHPVFNRPNKIGPDSWANWVQERGLYFLGERDPRYVDLVRTQDPFPLNASPQTGALVEAKVGKGRWIYIGLGLWRQLPAGTDGAYRLLANLLSLGKQ